MTDITLQELVNRALVKSGSGVVWLPQGDTLLREPLELRGQRGFRIEGMNMHSSRLFCDFSGLDANNDPRGPVPALGFMNCQDTEMKNFKVVLTDIIPAVFGYWRGQPSGTPTNNHHVNLVVIGQGEGYGGEATHGFHFRAVERDTPNNEASFSHNVHLNDCLIGWKIEGSQSKEHVMDHCRIQGGVHAVHSTGSFWWRGGGGSGLSDAVFRLREPVDTIRIDYAAFEASRRLLHASGPAGFSGDGQSIHISGGRFMCDQLHEDGVAVRLEHQGPLAIENFVFGSGSQPSPWIVANSPSGVSIGNVEFASWGSATNRWRIRHPDGAAASDPLRGVPVQQDIFGRTVEGERVRMF